MMLVCMGLQILVCIRLVGTVYKFVWMVFHLSSTWVQKGLLNLEQRVSVSWVRKAMGDSDEFPWFSRIFAQSSEEV